MQQVTGNRLTFRQWLGQQARIDRVIPAPFSTQRKRGWARVLVWPVLLIIYAIGWGDGAYSSIAQRFGEHGTPTPLTSELIRDEILMAAFMAAVGSVLMTVHCHPRSTSRLATILGGVPFGVAGMLVGFAVMGLTADLAGEDTTFPVHIPDELAGWYTVDLMMAGPAEEFVLIGLVAVALRKAEYGWGYVLVTAVLLRIPFHLYYGWSAITLGLWALAFVVLYRRLGTVIPLALAHALWNLTLRDGREALIELALFAVVLIVGFGFMRRPASQPIAVSGGR